VANDFTGNLLRNITNNLASATIDAAINGKPLNAETLADSLKSALITAGMAQGANTIGDWATPQNGQPARIDAFTQAVAHAVLGCAAGAAMDGGSCATGAVGGVVGELAAEFYNPTGTGNKAQTQAFAKLMAGVAGAMVSGDGNDAGAVNVAAATGGNAAANNYLKHTEVAQYIAAKSACEKGDTTACQQRDTLNALDKQRQQELAACTGNSSSDCQTKIEQAAQAFDGLVSYQADLQNKIKSGELDYAQAKPYLDKAALEVKDVASHLKDYFYGQAKTEDQNDPNWVAAKQLEGLNAQDLSSLWGASLAASVKKGSGSSTSQKNPVDEEIAALNRIGNNPDGVALNGKAPNSVLNQQAANDLANGKLPGVSIDPRTGLPDSIQRAGVPRQMPASSNPSATAEDFAIRALGRSPTAEELVVGAAMNNGNCPGCWNAKTSDGNFVSFRPAGSAGSSTAGDTATVEINYKSTSNSINNSIPLKLKFPEQP
jgi:hypothetical protein